KNMPHMISCGNNDLIDKKHSDAFNYYITTENKFANSVYAFDLGFTHFVCVPAAKLCAVQAKAGKFAPTE
ncbi:MAG: hypothetical protein RRZ69_07685, partial [Clostridia bacterium]